MNQQNIICPYCGRKADFLTQKEFYGEDYGGNIYVCRPCDARVTTKKNSNQPLGTMANWNLRKLRMNAHDALDPVWKNPFNRHTRTQVYTVLATLLNMNIEKTHIAMFNENMCLYVIHLVQTGAIYDKLNELEEQKRKKKSEAKAKAKKERMKEKEKLAASGKQPNNLTTKSIPEGVKLYGIFSTVSKKYCFGIQEPSKTKAHQALEKRIGKDSRKWRFEVRRIKFYAR